MQSQSDSDARAGLVYVVSNDPVTGEGNVLNVLRVDAEGRLEEVPTSPLKLPVRDDLLVRPQGVVAL